MAADVRMNLVLSRFCMRYAVSPQQLVASKSHAANCVILSFSRVYLVSYLRGRGIAHAKSKFLTLPACGTSNGRSVQRHITFFVSCLSDRGATESSPPLYGCFRGGEAMRGVAR